MTDVYINVDVTKFPFTSVEYDFDSVHILYEIGYDMKSKSNLSHYLTIVPLITVCLSVWDSNSFSQFIYLGYILQFVSQYKH